MRTIKLNKEQFRIWRLNAPPTEENGLSARDQIKKDLLEQNNGETFRLRSPMGPFLTTVRGENNSPTGMAMAPNGAPSPEACLCKQFAGTPEGKHHPVCQHRAAWEAATPIVRTGAAAPASPLLNPAMNVTSQKVMPPLDTTPKVQHMQVPQQVSMHQAPIKTQQAAVPSQALPAASPVAVVQTPAVIALISPEQCDCRQFTKPSDADPNQHHFVCQHFEKWRIAHPSPRPGEHETESARDTEPPSPESHVREEEYVLVDLDTQAVLREATSDEVDRAREEETKNGSPIITLDEGVYAVVTRPAPTLGPETQSAATGIAP